MQKVEQEHKRKEVMEAGRGRERELLRQEAQTAQISLRIIPKCKQLNPS
jgi:hypothetical protein